MKKYVVLWSLLFPLVSLAEVSEFSNDEIFQYLKPSNDVVFANSIAVTMNNDAETALQNNITLGGFKLTPHSVSSIAKEFDNNEITATEKYKNKAVRIKGVVRKIGLDALGWGVITVSGGGSFTGNLVASVDKTSGWVGKLSKGDKIDLVCNISGYVMLNVAAKCDSALSIAKDIVMKEYGLSENFSIPKTRYGALFSYVVKENEKKLEKPCSNQSPECFNTIMKVMNNMKKPEPEFVRWVESLPELNPSGNGM